MAMEAAPSRARVSAQVAEVHLAKPVLEKVRVPRGRGRPRKRPNVLVADKAYDSKALRHDLRRLLTRWEYHAHTYTAFLFIACALITLRIIMG